MAKRFATNPTAPKAPRAKKKKGDPAPEAEANNSLATDPGPTVSFETSNETANGTTPVATPVTGRSMKHMELVLTKSPAPRKSKRIVIYNIEGRTGSVQFLSTLFGGDQKNEGTPPEKLTLSGEFAEPKVKVAKEKETPEQRKARLAALPKLTLAEKIANAEKRAEELRAKLAKQTAKAAEAPAAPTA